MLHDEPEVKVEARAQGGRGMADVGDGDGAALVRSVADT
jgi:hypothetical protein